MASPCEYAPPPCWLRAPSASSAFQMIGRPLSRAIRAAMSREPVSWITPRPTVRKARENATTSRSDIKSVTMGVPS